MKKEFNPNLRTARFEYCREENNKLLLHLRQGEFKKDMRDASRSDIEWQTEQIAKSHGIYLEFDRSKTGDEKNWMYMIRVSIPGGGPLNRAQWNLIDELSEKYTTDTDGMPSIRFTTRQNIQFHWIKKPYVKEIVKRIAESGYNSLNGCGDNTRNVMACPCARHSDIYNAHAWARKAADFFQLPLDPFIQIFEIDPKYIRRPDESFQYGPTLLNRKFKIAFSAVHRDSKTGKLVPDNCVELRTHDLSVAPVVENEKVVRFQIYVGGGQGERNGKPTMAALGLPFAQVTEDQLLKTLDAIVQVHQEWGDRQNRFWARMKYVIKKMGVSWYRERVQEKLNFKLRLPDENLDYGARQMHHGWIKQPDNALWTYGTFLENGRIKDNSPNGKLKTMMREMVNKYPVEVMITPNQDALFTNIKEADKKNFEADLAKYGYGKRNGKVYSTLRLLSGACVGRDTCRLTYTDSEKFEPFLIDELEKLGWANMAESIGITGCERQCFRPATKTIGLVGSGVDRYQFKLFGDETGRFQGKPLISSDGNQMYLKSVPREKCSVVIDALFKNYQANKKDSEGLGAFHRRVGADALIKYLKENSTTADLMLKPQPTDCVIE